ncbi:hypothetical protein JVT61DRAFT_10366 [Boletus reticuloceps]|uniref:Uncharacterized protein n=1 Tax=Boletus reticuloceps TaxID=495285 RepID=A0A8I2YV13_9AGAM|nr:hypothetical protein JVT61DRAFT_10366 [Boletus reticuloceps]
MIRPARANAGKGGYLSQLRKTSEALDRPQCEQAKDVLENEPVNHLAPISHRPRKSKLCATQSYTNTYQATALEDASSDPLEANIAVILACSPKLLMARTGKGSVHSKQNSRNNFHDETTQMDIDDHHEHHPEDNSWMDINIPGGLFDFDDQQGISFIIFFVMLLTHLSSVPRSNHSHLHREDVIKDRNHVDHMDSTGDPAPRGDTQTQPPRRCPQSQPSQNTARDPCRHVSDARHLRDHILPSPPLSRSNSNKANGNVHHNNDAQANVVQCGDERANTDYNVLGRHHLSNCRCRSPDLQHLMNVCDGNHQNDGLSGQLQMGYEVPVPELEHTASGLQVPTTNVQGGNRQDDRASRQHLAEVPVAQQDHAAPTLQERAANVQEGNHHNDGSSG